MMPDFRVRLVGSPQSSITVWHGSKASQLSLSVAVANGGVCVDYREH